MELEEVFLQVVGRKPTPQEIRDPYWLAELRRACPALSLTGLQRENSQVMLYFPAIQEKGAAYFGGNQSWFERKAQRLAGCGSVAAANILACLAAQNPEVAQKLGLEFTAEKQISKNDFLRFMQQAYDAIGTFEVPIWNNLAENSPKEKHLVPLSFGRGGAGVENGILRFAQSKGVLLKSHQLVTSYAGYLQGLKFIQSGLVAGSPVCMLATQNRHPMAIYNQGYKLPPAPMPNGSKSHFVCITGVRFNKLNQPELLVSSWGKICVIPYGQLHKSWQSPKAVGSQMVYFTPATNAADTYRRRKMAYMALPRSVFQTVAGFYSTLGRKKK